MLAKLRTCQCHLARVKWAEPRWGGQKIYVIAPIHWPCDHQAVSVSLHGEPRCLHLQNGANITCVEDGENGARLATWKVFKNIKLYSNTCCNMVEP